jgi:hypothetical protein
LRRGLGRPADIRLGSRAGASRGDRLHPVGLPVAVASSSSDPGIEERQDRTMVDLFYRQTHPGIVALIVFGILLGLLRVGIILRRRRDAAQGHREDDDHTFENLTASAVLGLLALLLGFSFSLALDRFDVRRSMTLQEANAIRTMYARSQLIDEPDRSRLGDLLRKYTAHRIRVARIANPGGQRRVSERTEVYRDEISAATLIAMRPIRDTEFGASFMESANATLNIGAARKAARMATIPVRVLDMLILCMAVTSVTVGFVMDRGQGRWAAAALLLMLSMSYGLILDIDQPNRGAIRENQEPMEDLLRSMQDG